MLYIPLPVAAKVLPWVRPFNLEGRVVVPMVQGDFAVAARSEFRGWRGIITGYGVTVRSNPAYDWSGSLAFRLSMNGASIPSFDAGFWTAERGSVAVPLPTVFNIQPNSILTFEVRRAVAAAQVDTVDVSAIGFMWPLTVEKEHQDNTKYRV